MNLPETTALGVALSMDALAAAAALGAAERARFTVERMGLTAFFFGFFQAAMPVCGWAGGMLLGETVRLWGHYVAFALLAFCGGNMIYEAFHASPNKKSSPVRRFGLQMLTVLAFATSIDAFLVGAGFACLGRTSIVPDVLVIGFITFVLSLAGGCSGRRFGAVLGDRCGVFGGIILLLIGFKILIFKG